MRTLVCAALGWALVVGGLDAQDRGARDAATRDAARTRDAATEDAATRDAARTRDAATRDAIRTRDAAARDAARNRDARVTEERRRDRDNEKYGRIRRFDREARRLTVRMPDGKTRTFRITALDAGHRPTRHSAPEGAARQPSTTRRPRHDRDTL